MCNIKEYFTYIKPCNNPKKYGSIGDGKDKSKIELIAKIYISISGHRIESMNDIYVPTLECTLFSTKHHMRMMGWKQHTYNNQLMLTLPIFFSDATVNDEITITITNNADYQQIEFDKSTAKIHDRPSNKKTIPAETKFKSYEVHVISTYSTKDVDLIPTRSTPQ